VHLDWQHIYGAMFGNLGIRMPVDTKTGIADPSQTKQVFNGDGKMFRYLNGQIIAPQNQTISSIIVLRRYMVGQKRFEIAIKEKSGSLDGNLNCPTWKKWSGQVEQPWTFPYRSFR
jgi:hypothetical protein